MSEPSPSPANPRILAIHAHPDDIEFQCAGTLALLAEVGCPITLATMTPGDCGSVERDAEAIAAVRRAEAKASAGPDRGRLRLPGVPRPGDLRGRRVASEGRRGAPEGPARHRPDRAAGRLPLRPRGDQPPGPRRLLRRHAAQLQDPPVGAGSDPAEDSPPLLRGRHRRDRPRRPPPARRVLGRRLEGRRPQAPDARLPRQPARLAPEAARDRRVPRSPGPMGSPPRRRDRRGPRRGVPAVPRASLSEGEFASGIRRSGREGESGYSFLTSWKPPVARGRRIRPRNRRRIAQRPSMTRPSAFRVPSYSTRCRSIRPSSTRPSPALP